MEKNQIFFMFFILILGVFVGYIIGSEAVTDKWLHAIENLQIEEVTLNFNESEFAEAIFDKLAIATGLNATKEQRSTIINKSFGE